jgi:hypothetical protein
VLCKSRHGDGAKVFESLILHLRAIVGITGAATE